MTRSPLAQRLITGGALLVAFLLALFLLPPLGWALLMLVALILAAYELGRLLGSDGFVRFGMTQAVHYCWLLPMGLVAAVVSFLMFLRREDAVGQIGLFVACYALSLLLAVTVLPWWLFRNERQRLAVRQGLRAGLAITGGWLLFGAWLAMVQLRASSPWLLLAVLVLMWLADSAAYFCGRAFGRRKLAPQTSPGKTREGAAGAFAVVTVYALALAPSILPKMMLLQTLPAWAQWAVWLALAWLLTALSIVGDLFESLIKRLADRKDSGALLPGHGGVLDRIDSLLTTLPVAALAMCLLG